MEFNYETSQTMQYVLKARLAHTLYFLGDRFTVKVSCSTTAPFFSAGMTGDQILTASVNFGFMVIDAKKMPVTQEETDSCINYLFFRLIRILECAISELTDNELIMLVSYGKMDARYLETTLGTTPICRLRSAIYYVEHADETKIDKYPEGIKDVIFNGPATIVLWNDGTKTVVKAQNGEPVDHEKGLAMAIIKKSYDNKGCYYELFKKWCPED